MKDSELIQDIAEYLPDVFVNGMDCPDSQTAEEIILLVRENDKNERIQNRDN